jgi:hypothetical protein
MRFLLGALFVIICIMPSRSKRQAQSAKRQAQSAARQQRDAIDAVALVDATTDTAPAASQTALSSWLRSKRQAQSAARQQRDAIDAVALVDATTDAAPAASQTALSSWLRSKRQAQSAARSSRLRSKRQAQSAARQQRDAIDYCQQRDAIDAVALVDATTDTAPSAAIPAASQTALSSWLRSKRQAQSAARYSRAIPPTTLLPSPADGFLLGAKNSIKLIHPISNDYMNQESPRKQKRVKK